MSTEPTVAPTRRDAIKLGGAAAAAAGFGLAGLYAGESNTINIALVGCGGRGTGAASDALSTTQGPVKLVAMADAYEDRLKGSFNSLSKNKRLGDKVAVNQDTMFTGFEAYKQAIDKLSPGDIVILATPPAFRWVHFGYAIEKGVNVFMEKPVGVDGPSCKKMFELAKKSVQKGMKVGVGLMCRHCLARNEMVKRIKDGAIGDLVLLRAYRLAGPTGNMPVPKKPEKMNELEYQIRRFHGFLWASGGAYSDFLIHNIDECCWMKGDWPVKASSLGGREYKFDPKNPKVEWVDQNFDTYTTEFTFPDGTKLFMEGRTIEGCHQVFSSWCHGTKGSGRISTGGHWPSQCRLFKTQSMDDKDTLWDCGEEHESPYLTEWQDLMRSIRNDKPHNEVERGVKASLVTAMGRMAAHTGQIITYDQMLNHDHAFAPDVDKMTLGGEAPVKANDKGEYPQPLPGIKKKREY
jgi:predicted dehydrogenase